MGCCQVVEQTRRVTFVQWRDNDVKYSASSVEGFLKCKIANIRFDTLAKVVRVVLEEILWPCIESNNVEQKGREMAEWPRYKTLQRSF
mmetsp:Transcript_24234/g.56877  ORF Transcript_24234/g.56877 Transcript_24234/m.56877 type:complete len:88 (+) Transcript_24234:1395-1658(+)